MFYIKRNTQRLGPFTADQIISFYSNGDILDKDLIQHQNSEQCIQISEFLKMNNLSISQTSETFTEMFANTISVLKVMLNPFTFLKDGMKENSVILFLLSIVLIPLLALIFSEIPWITYTVHGLYFGLIWGLILFKTISTPQVTLKTTLLVGIGTALLSTILVNIIHYSVLGIFIESAIGANNFFINAIGMFLGVAIVEEFCKQALIYLSIHRSKQIVQIRTAIFYGMIAGLSFGIYEGIEYQMTVNKELDIDQNYFFNILRLTSLPFFHAIWAGIGAYFISLSFLNLKYKYSLRLIGLITPAFLHTTYNLFGISLIGIAAIAFSAILLMVYLTKNDKIGMNLNTL